jgi:hypothetical protein
MQLTADKADGGDHEKPLPKQQIKYRTKMLRRYCKYMFADSIVCSLDEESKYSDRKDLASRVSHGYLTQLRKE